MDYVDDWFATLTLFNMMIGLTNAEKNKSQQIKQESIEKKLDLIIDLLERNKK